MSLKFVNLKLSKHNRRWESEGIVDFENVSTFLECKIENDMCEFKYFTDIQ